MINKHDAILTQLLRAIALSEGEFALLLARCNSLEVRDRLMVKLRSQLGVGLLVWNATSETGAVNLVDCLEDAPDGTRAACITGLESSPQLNDILAIANNAREEFRKRLAFPVVLWVTDEVEMQLRRRSPDLASWAAPPFVFALDQSELQAILERETEDVLDWAFSPEGKPGVGLELQGAWQEWQQNGVTLSPELEARVVLAFGMEAGSDEAAREALERCLDLVETGALAAAAHYRLGLWWERWGKLNRVEFLGCCDRAREELQQAWDDPAGKHPNVGLALGGVLLALALLEPDNSDHWQAVTALTNELNGLPAFACGLRAEVALSQQNYTVAKREAERALQGNDQERIGFYLLSLGRSQLGLGQVEDAIASLEKAKARVLAEVDPDLHIRVLWALHGAYTAAKDYQRAFAAKCDRVAVETQYGFRAFIGAGRLRPQRRVGALGEAATEEIAASGRQADIDALVERVKRNDCRLTVVHGPSGVGKSSLIQAGLVPALRKLIHQSRSVVPVVIEHYEDWQGELAQKIQAAFPQHSLLTTSQNVEVSESQPDVSLATKMLAQLRENDRQNLITVLIFDQFEEFFFKHFDVSGRRQLYDFLRECLNTPYVWIFLSLREDYVHYLLECDRLADFKLINNDILNKNVRYYLGNFSQDRAKAVIRDLLEKSPYRLDGALIDRWVADLAEDLGEVRPIEMQVVGAQMVDSDAKILTLADYQLLGERPKQRLVERWLAEVVEDCGQENEELAQRVLFALTEEPEKRPLKTKTELQRDVHLLMPSDSPEEQEQSVSGDIDYVLTVPIGSGLAFEIPASPEACYQLIHDYLVPPIRQQFGEKLTKQLEEERKKRKLAEDQNTIITKQNRKLKLTSLIAGVLTVITATLGGIAVLQTSVIMARNNKIDRQQLEIEKQKSLLAEVARQRAIYAQIKAMQQQKIAEKLRNQAESNRVEAVKQGQIAENRRILADKERNAAEIAKTSEQKQRNIAEQQRLIAEKQTNIARRAEEQASQLAKINKLDAINGHAVLDSLYWKGWMDAEVFNLEQQVVALEKAKVWKTDLNTISESSRLELLTTLHRSAHIPREKNRFEGHDSEVLAVAFSPDGKTILTGSADKTAKLWNLNGQVLQIFKGHQDAITSVAFSPDGKTILTGSYDKTARLWNLNGKLLTTFVGHQNAVTNIVFSPDGKTILTSSRDHTAKLWRIRDGVNLATFLDRGNVTSIAISPDGKTIVTGSDDKTAKLWNLLSGELLNELIGHQGAIRSVAFSPDGQRILTGSDDKTARVWNLNGELLTTLNGHQDSVTKAIFSSGGYRILTRSNDRTLKLWTFDGDLLQTFNWYVDNTTSIALSPDGKSLVTGGAVAKLWSLDEQLLPIAETHSSNSNVRFSPDGKILLIVEKEHGIVKLQSLNGKLLASLTAAAFKTPRSGFILGDSRADSEIHSLIVNQIYIYSAVFSPDGQKILVGSSNETAELFKVDGQRLQTFQGHQGNILSVAFSPDGKTIVTGSNDKTAKLWGLDGRLLQTFTGHTGAINSVAFSPDGKTIVTGSNDTTAKLWGLDGRLLQTFTGHTGAITSVAFSPDGKTIVTGSNDTTAKLWGLDGRLLQTFTGHTGAITSVAFSLGGKTIVTGSNDTTAKLWGLDGRTLQTFTGHTGAITSVAFSPDGESIVTGSDDRKVKVWNFHINTSITSICDYLQPFIEGLNNPFLPENGRQMRIRARRACEGIPPPKTSTLSPQTKKTPNPLTWATQLLSQTFQSLIKRP